jgi:hypothetical protein
VTIPDVVEMMETTAKAAKTKRVDKPTTWVGVRG